MPSPTSFFVLCALFSLCAATCTSDAGSDLPKEYNFCGSFVTGKCIVQDQASCGSCYSFAAAGVLHDRMYLASGGSVDVVPSEQAALDCSTTTYKCNGGWAGDIMQIASTQGLPSGKCVPYEAGNLLSLCGSEDNDCKIKEGLFHKQCPMSDSKCTAGFFERFPPWKSVSWDGRTYGKHYRVDVGSDDACREVKIRREIFNHGPVATSFRVTHAFQNFFLNPFNIKSVFKTEEKPGDYVGSHAVVIVGWGESSDGPYWLLRNSWGHMWGELGYFRMKRGSNFMQVESSIDAASVSATKEMETDASSGKSGSTAVHEGDAPGSWVSVDAGADHVAEALQHALTARSVPHDEHRVLSSFTQVVSGVQYRFKVHTRAGRHHHHHDFSVHRNAAGLLDVLHHVVATVRSAAATIAEASDATVDAAAEEQPTWTTSTVSLLVADVALVLLVAVLVVAVVRRVRAGPAAAPAPGAFIV